MPGNPPNLDVMLDLPDGEVIGIESKFTEWLTLKPKSRIPFKDLGRHFKAPKKSDTEQWKKVAFLIDHGFFFQKIRPDSNGNESVPYPKTLDEAKEFVVKYNKWSAKNAT